MQSKASMFKYLDGIHTTSQCEVSFLSIVMFLNTLAEKRLDFIFAEIWLWSGLKVSFFYCYVFSSQNNTKGTVLHSQHKSIGRERGYIHVLRPKGGAERLIPPLLVASFPTI